MYKIFYPARLLAALVMTLGVLLLPCSAAQAAEVGVCDRQAVFNAYPGISDIMQQIQTMREAAQKDYNEQTKELAADDPSRKSINDQVAKDEAKQEDKLMQPVVTKISGAIRDIAKEKGLSTVIDAASALYGGNDITKDVIARVKE